MQLVLSTTHTHTPTYCHETLYTSYLIEFSTPRSKATLQEPAGLGNEPQGRITMAEVVPAQRQLSCARHDGLRLLSIDGGGVKGLAALHSLKKVMEQLKKEENDPCPRPCDHFDMMVGTSTGG